MVYFPLTQAEIDLCFVPAHEQFARAKELRLKLHSPVHILPRPVLIGTGAVLIETRQECELVEVVEPVRPAIPVNDYIECGVFDFSQSWEHLPGLINAMTEFMERSGVKPIRTGKDCAFFMKSIEAWARLNAGDLACKRRMHEYIIPRRYYIQKMKVFSAWSFPQISKTVGIDHSSAIHACQQPAVGIYDVYMDGSITPPRRSINYVIRQDKPIGVKNRIIKGKRWTFERDQMLIEMLRQGMTHPKITDVFCGMFTLCAVGHRVKVLRRRGQL